MRRRAPSLRRVRFGEPLVERAVAAHLARSEIAESDAQPHRDVLGDRGSESNLEIVWMWSKDQQVYLADVVHG